MRIIQLIDSLEAGGAERMAVNLSNALSKKIEYSGLVTTRHEGSLKKTIFKSVDYLFLNKKKTIDIQSIMKLLKYCNHNKIEIMHAHSSSFFLAAIIKLLRPKTKIIWHDHYGNNELLHLRSHKTLKICSCLFDGIIAVNQNLLLWSKSILNHKNAIYLPNFPQKTVDNQINKTILNGNKNKKIVCIANLRPQKDHFLLLEIAEMVFKNHPDWSFHLVGKDFEDQYSDTLKSQIVTKKLQNVVFIYGSKNDIQNILNQSEIAILTSESEGLPVSLLEYGMNKKAVVLTSVGEIPNIINNNQNGLICPAKNTDLFVANLIQLIENPELRTQFGNALFETISNDFSEEKIIEKYLDWLKN